MALSLRSFGGYGNSWDAIGGIDVNSTQWLQAVNASNTTGLFKIPGYDVSQPWPGTPIDGWTLSVAAVDVLPDSSAEERVVGYSLSVKAPDSIINQTTDGTGIVNVNRDWGMCIWNWEWPAYGNLDGYSNRNGTPLADDGSCKGFLSDECISVLEMVASKSYGLLDGGWGPFNSQVDCSISIETPAECGGSVGGSTNPSSSLNGVPIQYLNGSVTLQDGWTINQTTTTTQDIEDMWDGMVVNFWPVMTLFVPIGDNLTEVKPGFANLSCIAPDGVGTGKVFTYADQTGYKKGAGNAAVEPAGLVALFTFALAVLIEAW